MDEPIVTFGSESLIIEMFPETIPAPEPIEIPEPIPETPILSQIKKMCIIS